MPNEAIAEIGTELEKFDESRVTIFWKKDIKKAKEEIDTLLADTELDEDEKAILNEYKAQCDKLIEIITTPSEYCSTRFFYLIWDCFTWKYNSIIWILVLIFSC